MFEPWFPHVSTLFETIWIHIFWWNNSVGVCLKFKPLKATRWQVMFRWFPCFRKPPQEIPSNQGGLEYTYIHRYTYIFITHTQTHTHIYIHIYISYHIYHIYIPYTWKWRRRGLHSSIFRLYDRGCVLNSSFSTPVPWDLHLNFYSELIKRNLERQNWIRMRKKLSKAFVDFWVVLWFLYVPPLKKNCFTMFDIYAVLG